MVCDCLYFGVSIQLWNVIDLIFFPYFFLELTQRVQRAEKAAGHRDPNYFTIQFSALKNDEIVTLNNISTMENEIKKSYEIIEKLKRECSEIERKSIEFRESLRSQLPRALYSH
jgi:hypothetical protein